MEPGNYSGMYPLGKLLEEVGKDPHGYQDIEFDNKLFRVQFIGHVMRTPETLPPANGQELATSPAVQDAKPDSEEQ